MNSGIYIITNTINNKVYIGSAIDIKRRHSQHFNNLKKGKHPNIHLQRSWNKHGEDAFRFERIFKCCNALLIWHEQRVIDIYKESIGWDMIFNLDNTAGSRLGAILSQETRIKIGKANKGRKASSEARAKMSAAHKGNTYGKWHKGRKKSPEHRAKIGKANKSRKYTPEMRANMSAAQKGKKASLEARANMSKAGKGKKKPPFTAEHRANLSKAIKKRFEDPKERANMSKAKKEYWRKKRCTE